MSAPQRPVLESVQQAANYFAYLQGRGIEPDVESETYQRVTQGLSASEIDEARHYASQAEQLRRELLAAPPGTRISELPSYGSLIGLSPVANVVHMYGERDAETGVVQSPQEYRSDPHALGPASTYRGLIADAVQMDVREWTPPASELDVDYVIDYIKPFNLYA